MVPPEVNTATLCELSTLPREYVAGRLERARRPASFQPWRIVGAGQPALDDQGEDALEFAAFCRAVTQDVHRVGFDAEQVEEHRE